MKHQSRIYYLKAYENDKPHFVKQSKITKLLFKNFIMHMYIQERKLRNKITTKVLNFSRKKKT